MNESVTMVKPKKLTTQRAVSQAKQAAVLEDNRCSFIPAQLQAQGRGNPIQLGKKERGKKMSLSELNALFSSEPSGASASGASGNSAPAPSFAQVALAPKPKAPAASAAPQQAKVEKNDATATNPLVVALIGSMHGYAVEGIQYNRSGPDTVYYDVSILGPKESVEGALNLQQNRYILSLHCHPRPDTQNWLHLKVKDGGSAGNVIAPDNAILSGYRHELNAGIANWEQETNKKATKSF
ncbi:hypothetical protein [Pseudoalteromonas byunsanensis]|uniref:Uncharacterized protein n=1 Tax=Pseudoalteromonas byunsanensis TaxID=327939 RepID=A0A1S1N590_9GAMM|nr:hypothetical protein [Pseudoalteromonas byunsanensis]OHU95173.1 hypothetical protein BIW53_10625 [Pseudoalteromonas byunsanensis]